MGVPVFAPRFATDHLKPFYEGLEAGELRLTACSECGRWLWYPPEVSPCHPQAEIEWRAASPRGEVYTFTTITRSLLPGDHAAEPPYTVVLVEPEDAAGARVVSLFLGEAGEEPVCGMRVELAPVRAGDHTVAAFRPMARPA
jgi:uncharacterized OB-fold protein